MKRKYLPLAIAATFVMAASAMAEGDKMNRAANPQGTHSQQMGNEQTRELQRALQNKGHNVGPIDGIAGPMTQSALRDYQRAQGIDVTGRADDRTLSSLGVTASAGTSTSNMGSSPSPSGSTLGTPGSMGNRPDERPRTTTPSDATTPTTPSDATTPTTPPSPR